MTKPDNHTVQLRVNDIVCFPDRKRRGHTSVGRKQYVVEILLANGMVWITKPDGSYRRCVASERLQLIGREDTMDTTTKYDNMTLSELAAELMNRLSDDSPVELEPLNVWDQFTLEERIEVVNCRRDAEPKEHRYCYMSCSREAVINISTTLEPKEIIVDFPVCAAHSVTVAVDMKMDGQQPVLWSYSTKRYL